VAGEGRHPHLAAVLAGTPAATADDAEESGTDLFARVVAAFLRGLLSRP
jgi:hypothetical protein